MIALQGFSGFSDSNEARGWKAAKKWGRNVGPCRHCTRNSTVLELGVGIVFCIMCITGILYAPGRYFNSGEQRLIVPRRFI